MNDPVSADRLQKRSRLSQYAETGHAFRAAWPAMTIALVMLSASLPAGAGDVPYDYHVPLTPENVIIGHFSPTKKPVLSVKSGAVVRIDGGGGARSRGGELSAESVDAWLKENGIPITVARTPALAETIKVLKETPRADGIPSGHLIVGPISVEDAEPGDSLEVRILDVTPRIPYGNTGSNPGRGAMALNSTPAPPAGTPMPAAPSSDPTGGTVLRPFSKLTRIDRQRNAGIFDDKIEVPLAPFMGVMGTCPPDSEGPYRRSTAPGVFGGNLDCSELTTGSTLYLPVFQPGALFYTGDSHAGQGDGEVTGTAIETANTCTLQFILHKGKTLKLPRAETPTAYITFGLDPDLDLAMRQATSETLDFLQEKQGFDIFQAYALSSIAVSFRVTQVVDRTLGIHAMIPKKIFIHDSNTYWYRPR